MNLKNLQIKNIINKKYLKKKKIRILNQYKKLLIQKSKIVQEIYYNFNQKLNISLILF